MTATKPAGNGMRPGGSMKIGAVTITRVVEFEGPGGMRRFLPHATPEALETIPWLVPHFATEAGRMLACIQALVVETPDRRVVVDTCIGNDKPRNLPAWNMMRTGFLEDMIAAGYPPESIDTVLCTHLHVDHVGWNTRLVDGRWVPTFANARYLMGRIEYDHWSRHDDDAQLTVMEDSVKPVLDAGLADFVETDHVICPELRLIPTTGHTPGHVSLLIESQGESALITGDFCHHPCQMAHPEWCSLSDSDASASEATRREMFARYAGSEVIFVGTHFATPTAGFVRRDGGGYRLDVLPLS